MWRRKLGIFLHIECFFALCFRFPFSVFYQRACYHQVGMQSRDVPALCEVELIILAYRCYKVAACIDGSDVIVALASSRADAYLAAKEWKALARLGSGLVECRPLRLIIDLVVKNGHFELLFMSPLLSVEVRVSN